jgi:hypothetical protein
MEHREHEEGTRLHDGRDRIDRGARRAPLQTVSAAPERSRQPCMEAPEMESRHPPAAIPLDRFDDPLSRTGRKRLEGTEHVLGVREEIGAIGRIRGERVAKDGCVLFREASIGADTRGGLPERTGERIFGAAGGSQRGLFSFQSATRLHKTARSRQPEGLRTPGGQARILRAAASNTRRPLP